MTSQQSLVVLCSDTSAKVNTLLSPPISLSLHPRHREQKERIAEGSQENSISDRLCPSLFSRLRAMGPKVEVENSGPKSQKRCVASGQWQILDGDWVVLGLVKWKRPLFLNYPPNQGPYFWRKQSRTRCLYLIRSWVAENFGTLTWDSPRKIRRFNVALSFGVFSVKPILVVNVVLDLSVSVVRSWRLFWTFLGARIWLLISLRRTLG